jgi:hypothetical protein
MVCGDLLAEHGELVVTLGHLRLLLVDELLLSLSESADFILFPLQVGACDFFHVV